MDAPRGRARILEAAYELFTRRGIARVGVDAIIEHAGTAKMTLYRNYASRDELALEVLRTREQRWTFGWLDEETARRATSPQQRLLAIFDMFADWFTRPDFEGCLFLKGVLEYEDGVHLLREASVDHLHTIRELLRRLAADAGAEDPVELARRWHVLMMGSIMAAESGDAAAAVSAHEMGVMVLRAEGLLDPQ